MDRREFLRTTGAAAAATATAATATAEVAAAKASSRLDPIAAPAVAANVRHLRMTLSWPDGAAGPADQARRLAQRITLMSGGRYRFDIVPGAGDGLGVVRSGAADLYYGSENDHLETHRALAYFAGLPGNRGIAPRHLVAWLLVGGGELLWDELAADFGVKAMLAGHCGESCFVAGRNISAMADLAGKRVSVCGLAREVVRGIGLEPVAADAGSLPGRLASGDILAAELGGSIATHALGLSAVAPYSVGTEINRHGFGLSLGIGRATWDSLSPSDQALFTAAAAAETQLALAEEESHRRLLHPAPPAEKVWPIAAELERAIARVADAVVAHVASCDVAAARINGGYAQFRRLALGEERHPVAGA